MLEFHGIRGQDDCIRLPGLAWSWGVSSAGGRGRRGGWGGDDEEQEKPEDKDETLGLNVQDLSTTVYMERNFVRGPLNSILRGKHFARFRLVAFSRVRNVKEKGEGEQEADTRTEEELIEAGELEMIPYMYIETVGRVYVSSCSMGGSGGEEWEEFVCLCLLCVMTNRAGS